MKVLWNSAWFDAPAYSEATEGELLRVEAAAPLTRLQNPTGRLIRTPRRKAWRFLRMDGPWNTVRKVRAKRETARLHSDYRVVAVLGRRVADHTKVLALACRIPPCLEYVVVHRDLVIPGEAASEFELRVVARILGRNSRTLMSLGQQSYLYSGVRPPPELTRTFQNAVTHALTIPPRASGVDDEPAILHLPETTGPPTSVVTLAKANRAGTPVALLGAGDYARMEIVPALTRTNFDFTVVADREPHLAAHMARTRGFRAATTDPFLAIERLPRPGLVIVATAHDSHASLAATALDAGHRVFLEKPAVVSHQDLSLLMAAAHRAPGMLELGFNRRFHPLVQRLRALISSEGNPITVSCVVRELTLLPHHWYFWPNQGTRVAGNLCHWIDLIVFLVGPHAQPAILTVSPPAPGAPDSSPCKDSDRVISGTFDDGSLMSLIPTDRGDDIRGVHETVEVRANRVSVTLDDLRHMTVVSNGRSRRFRMLWRDKGHQHMLHGSFARVQHGQPAIYPLADLLRTSRIQLAATELLPGGGMASLMP
jgi:predicted dehydrogenase